MSSSTGEKKHKIGIDEEASDDVFEYTDNGQIVEKDVVSVRFHPSAIEVRNEAFKDCNKLQEVVLNDGLRDIGESAFQSCSALQRITIPSTSELHI